LKLHDTTVDLFSHAFSPANGNGVLINETIVRGKSPRNYP